MLASSYTLLSLVAVCVQNYANKEDETGQAGLLCCALGIRTDTAAQAAEPFVYHAEQLLGLRATQPA